MTIPYTKRVTVSSEVIAREVDGELVLLNLDSELYFSLNVVGTDMWKALTSTPSIQAALDALLREYDVQPDVLHTDLDGLLAQLAENGLITFSDS